MVLQAVNPQNQLAWLDPPAVDRQMAPGKEHGGDESAKTMGLWVSRTQAVKLGSTATGTFGRIEGLGLRTRQLLWQVGQVNSYVIFCP